VWRSKLCSCCSCVSSVVGVTALRAFPAVADVPYNPEVKTDPGGPAVTGVPVAGALAVAGSPVVAGVSILLVVSCSSQTQISNIFDSPIWRLLYNSIYAIFKLSENRMHAEYLLLGETIGMYI
jgi:hypothetical protein